MSNSDNVIPLFEDDPDAELRQRMIDIWEALYLKRGQTLTDTKTAESLRVSMEMVTLLLDGAHANEVIDASQRDQLYGIVHTGYAAADEFQK